MSTTSSSKGPLDSFYKDALRIGNLKVCGAGAESRDDGLRQKLQRRVEGCIAAAPVC